MAICGIPRIDDLNSGVEGATSIGVGESEKECVGLVQQMLAGMGHTGLPNLLSADYGTFGPRTVSAVRAFRAAQGLPGGEDIDAQCLQTLVQASATVPVASRGYLTLVLDIPYTGLAKIVSVVAQMEGAGKFSALNLNTDKAGLSFGLIQWAQKPGRLAEILNAFSTASPDDFHRIFGDGDAALGAQLIKYTQKPRGGVDPATGLSVDPAFDLINEPWLSRFRNAAVFKPFQKVQVETALDDFADSLKIIQSYAPELDTERALGFMLDVANQFGDRGLHSIYDAVAQNGMPVSELLQGIADESVDRIQDPWKLATQARRQHFLATRFLSDDPFVNVNAVT